MNHPEKVLVKAHAALLAGERIFYCRYDPDIIFTASDRVIETLNAVTFISIIADGYIQGIINSDNLKSFNDNTVIIGTYRYRDFIEIDREDPEVWG
jgi:hypothetical protein